MSDNANAQVKLSERLKWNAYGGDDEKLHGQTKVGRVQVHIYLTPGPVAPSVEWEVHVFVPSGPAWRHDGLPNTRLRNARRNAIRAAERLLGMLHPDLLKERD